MSAGVLSPRSADCYGSIFNGFEVYGIGFCRRHSGRADHGARAAMVESMCAMTGPFGVALGKETRTGVFSTSIRAAIFRKVVRMTLPPKPGPGVSVPFAPGDRDDEASSAAVYARVQRASDNAVVRARHELCQSFG